MSPHTKIVFTKEKHSKTFKKGGALKGHTPARVSMTVCETDSAQTLKLRQPGH